MTRAPVLSVALFLIMQGSLIAQEPTACRTCSIQIDRVVELSSAAGTFTPSMAVSVARIGAGTYLVSPLFRPPQIVQYAGDGRILRTYERTGSGPGEFQAGPVLFVAPGGEILAADQSRIVKLTPDLRHLETRTVPLRVGANTTVLPAGALVVGTPTATDAGRTYLTSIVNSSGVIVQNIDDVAGRGVLQRAVLAPAQVGFWSGRTNSSELINWSEAGKELRRLRIQRRWFQPWEGEVVGEPYTVRPRPRTVALREISPDRLLVLTNVAGSTWRALGEAGTEVRIRPISLNTSDLYDSVIEWVDARSGAVLAQRTVPDRLIPVEGTTDQFASTREDPDGHVVVDIWQVRLQGPPPPVR